MSLAKERSQNIISFFILIPEFSGDNGFETLKPDLFSFLKKKKKKAIGLEVSHVVVIAETYLLTS